MVTELEIILHFYNKSGVSKLRLLPDGLCNYLHIPHVYVNLLRTISQQIIIWPIVGF